MVEEQWRGTAGDALHAHGAGLAGEDFLAVETLDRHFAGGAEGERCATVVGGADGDAGINMVALLAAEFEFTHSRVSQR
ncbi:MAG TPA: hypothetical protein PLU79_00560 [Burkholderiaceae bacterium]|nr:hypothetical protein [Burkholderiaceae bacterium]